MPKILSEAEKQTTIATIKSLARQQMAAEGTAAVSLRWIARQMNRAAPSLYHYFPTRDDLLTALIVDNFNALADAVEAAKSNSVGLPIGEQLLALSAAYRAYALTYPADFQLIYGNPIPDYKAPAEVTVPAVVRIFRAFIELILQGIEAGQIIPKAESTQLPLVVEAQFQILIEQDQYPITPTMMYIGIAAWTQLHGLVMLEIFNHLPPTIGDSDIFFHHRIRAMYRDLGVMF